MAAVLRRKRGLWFVLLLAFVAACGGNDLTDGAPGGTGSSGEGDGDEEAADYEVLLGTPLVDTLRGDARFGLVTDSDTGHNVFVIELQTGFDFAGGFFLVYGNEGPPAPGTHDLVPLADSLGGVPPGRYAILYRQGMLKDLVSREGQLTLSGVTDTLITGTFDVMLQGFLTNGQQRLPNAEVRARGRFQASPGNTGYIIGL